MTSFATNILKSCKWLRVGLLVVLAGPAGASTPTGNGIDYDSAKDWREHAFQPDGTWRYGRYAGAGAWSSFVPLSEFASFDPWIGGTGMRWGTEPSVGQFAMLPSASDWAIRRWTSPVAGSIEIDYDVMRIGGAVGDNGQVVGIYRNGNALWSQDLGSPPHGLHETGTLAASVQIGDIIDFMVDSKGETPTDWTHFHASIRARHLRSAPPTGLAAHWTLDEAGELPDGPDFSRVNRAADRSGNLHHAALQFMLPDDWITGRMGNMLDLDGGDDHLTTVDTDIADGATALTLSAWISPDSQGGWRGILTARNAGDNGQYFGLTSTGYGVNAIEFRALNQRIQSLDHSVPYTAWTHVVGVWQSGTLFKLYLNGVEASLAVSSSPPVGVVDIDTWYAGTDRLIGGRYFNGRIDDLSLWTRALNDTEILELFRLGINGWDASYLGHSPPHLLPHANGLRVWLDAQNIDGRGNQSLTDHDEVLSWFNQAGGLAGNASAGAGAALAGRYRAGAGPKGADVLRLEEGRTDALQFWEFMASDTFSVFAVAHATGGQQSRPLFWDSGAAGATVVFSARDGAWVRDPDGDAIAVTSGTPWFTSKWQAGFMILAKSGGDYTLEAGTTAASGSAGNPQYDVTSWEATTAAPHIGASPYGSSSHHCAGDITELLVYDHALSAADRDALLAYLDRKYFQHQGGLLLKIR